MSERRSCAFPGSFRLHSAALLLFFLISLQSMFFASDVKAAIIPWDSNNNDGSGFYWSNGGSDKGYFVTPSFTDGKTTLHFSLQNFSALSTNGKTSTQYDRLQVDIIAKPGEVIKSVTVTESGSYDINTMGKVSDSGAILITNLSQYEVRSASFAVEPTMPITATSTIEGSWDGQASVDNLNWTYLRIVLNNNLCANSLQGPSSYIDKTCFDIHIDIPNSVPEPATLAVLTFGTAILPLYRRNKRH